MKKLMKSLDNTLTKIEENLTFILLLAMLLAVFASFVSRYVFNSPIDWTEEFSRYVMIWATFIAASYGVKTGAHITLDIMVIYLSDKGNKILRTVSYILSLVYCVLVIYIGIPFINNLIETQQKSPAMEIPMYFVYLSIIVGTVLMFLRYVILLFNEFSNSNQLEKVN
ncbi:TRAP transporter small permease [Bacillus sp. Marseille-P3661]|uniref:TRAP transporter small permease n=1 Tax=Bacillus sp. Marseille-P3661 TaxID=1936234 RepID=UPI000C8453AB|nr:TRAP transporter small permease [Bacillus sp. Marseille-P3661]